MNLYKFVPTKYYKSVLSVDYKELRNMGIKCLVFDLNNTLAIVKDKYISDDIVGLINKISEDFKIIILSNNFSFQIKKICSIINTDCISFALKPSKYGFSKIKAKYHYTNKDICIIGDQLFTDILLGNRMGAMTILVDPLSKKDWAITKTNRLLEKRIFKELEEHGILERGKYYG